MTNDDFIQDTEQFQSMQHLTRDVFHMGRELPEQVFHKGYSGYVFEQFDLSMEPQFWLTLQKLAKRTNDEFVVLAVLKPDPTDYFYREFNCFNWLQLPVTLTDNEYWTRLEAGPNGSPADAILYNSSLVVWVPPSKHWAIFGDRNAEICVLGFQKDEFNAKDLVGDWKTVNDEALKGWLSLSCGNEEWLIEFMRKLADNYSR